MADEWSSSAMKNLAMLADRILGMRERDAVLPENFNPYPLDFDLSDDLPEIPYPVIAAETREEWEARQQAKITPEARKKLRDVEMTNIAREWEKEILDLEKGRKVSNANDKVEDQKTSRFNIMSGVAK